MRAYLLALMLTVALASQAFQSDLLVLDRGANNVLKFVAGTLDQKTSSVAILKEPYVYTFRGLPSYFKLNGELLEGAIPQNCVGDFTLNVAYRSASGKHSGSQSYAFGCASRSSKGSGKSPSVFLYFKGVYDSKKGVIQTGAGYTLLCPYFSPGTFSSQDYLLPLDETAGKAAANSLRPAPVINDPQSTPAVSTLPAAATSSSNPVDTKASTSPGSALPTPSVTAPSNLPTPAHSTPQTTNPPALQQTQQPAISTNDFLSSGAIDPAALLGFSPNFLSASGFAVVGKSSTASLPTQTVPQGTPETPPAKVASQSPAPATPTTPPVTKPTPPKPTTATNKVVKVPVSQTDSQANSGPSQPPPTGSAATSTSTTSHLSTVSTPPSQTALPPATVNSQPVSTSPPSSTPPAFGNIGIDLSSGIFSGFAIGTASTSGSPRQTASTTASSSLSDPSTDITCSNFSGKIFPSAGTVTSSSSKSIEIDSSLTLQIGSCTDVTYFPNKQRFEVGDKVYFDGYQTNRQNVYWGRRIYCQCN